MNLLTFIAAVLLATCAGCVCWWAGEILARIAAWCLGLGGRDE